VHEQGNGKLSDYRPEPTNAPSGSEQVPEQAPDVLATAMGHLNEMTFRFMETESEKGRAKAMASSCMKALKPHLVATLGPLVDSNVSVAEVVDPLLNAIDQVMDYRQEHRERHTTSALKHPPLRVHRRELGERPAVDGKKRKAIDRDIAYAYDTNLEELLEREIAYDPQILNELIVADRYWTTRAGELAKCDERDPNRVFTDQCDGSVWQAHEVLGDPDYCGPTRVVLQAYCDDVDIPNPLGPASGHSKLYIQTVTIVNRPSRTRMSMRAQYLSTVCLSNDFKTFGAHAVISGSGDLSTALGSQLRRLWKRGMIRLPPEVSPKPLEIRRSDSQRLVRRWHGDGGRVRHQHLLFQGGQYLQHV